MRQLDSKIYKAVQILWIDRDLDKGGEAIRLFEESAAEGNADAYYFPARCYAGECYVDVGFGVPADIKTGMSYWSKFPNHSAVTEHKKNFRKTLFGWKRIQ